MDFFFCGGDQEHANKTPSYDTKLLPAFVKIKISYKFKQNIYETHLKQPKIHSKIHTSPKKISRKKSVNQKSHDFFRNVCDFQKENHTLGYGF
jgi:hypothetical protein